MASLPQAVNEAWEKREGPAVFTTVSPDGTANSVYVGALKKLDDGRIAIADNYFDKTRRNILAGSSGVLLFITSERKAYQLKGVLDYQKEGAIYEDMKSHWLDPKYPGHAVVVLSSTEAYSGAEKLT